MTDVSSLGPRGQAMLATAQQLLKAKVIDQAQFDELKNTDVGPKDMAIADAAAQKITADTPDALALIKTIQPLKSNILSLQTSNLGATLGELGQEAVRAFFQFLTKTDTQAVLRDLKF